MTARGKHRTLVRSNSGEGGSCASVASAGTNELADGFAASVPSPSEGCLLPPLLSGRAIASIGALVAEVAPTPINVLLLGETGVGKGVVAQQIHTLSTCAGERFLQVNCAGLSTPLLESDLFGHKKGAFTGADRDKKGKLEVAAGGTVFLDEVGEMPMEVQAKLLVAVEQRVVWPVGATESTPIEVRFVFATHRDLEAESRLGRFRADFYYRIKGLSVRIPPLRERRDEIEGLTLQFARDAAANLKRDRPPVFDDDARARLHRYDWPGNIRELRSVVELAVLLSKGNPVTSRILVAAGLPDDGLPSPDRSPDHAKRDRLISVLAACGGNQTRAAQVLGIARNTLIHWIEKYNLMRPRKNDPRRAAR